MILLVVLVTHRWSCVRLHGEEVGTKVLDEVNSDEDVTFQTKKVSNTCRRLLSVRSFLIF